MAPSKVLLLNFGQHRC